MQNFKREIVFGLASMLVILVIMGINIYQYSKNMRTPITSPITKPQPNIILSSNEIKKHNIQSDCWLIVENKVYDATLYLSRHPGGAFRIIPFCGSDATQAFITQGGNGSHSGRAFQELSLLYIGDLNGNQTNIPNTNTINSLTPNEDDD